MFTAAREFIEAALSVSAYMAYLEFCSGKHRAETRILKNFTKRSAGPLWKLFRESMEHLGKSAAFCAAFRELLEPQLFKEVDEAVTLVALSKHGKVSEASADVLRPVQILANISHKVFSEHFFGMFQQVQKQRFGKQYEGIFRHAHGWPPFLATSEYKGSLAFSANEPFILNATARIALPFEPLLFWEACKAHPELENGHCYMFDSAERNGDFSFKAVGFPCTCRVGPNTEYHALAGRLQAMMEHDQTLELVRI